MDKKAKSTQICKRHGQLSVDELLSGEKLVCKVIQQYEFLEEYSQLTKGETIITKKSKLFRLSPYLDEDSIIRIVGRLNKVMVQNMAKHQIALPATHNLVNLLIKSYHDMIHNSTGCIISEMRPRYWILKARTTIKKILRQCFHCRKIKTKAATPYMSDHASFRLDYQNPTFTNTGVNFFGPIFIK